MRNNSYSLSNKCIQIKKDTVRVWNPFDTLYSIHAPWLGTTSILLVTRYSARVIMRNTPIPEYSKYLGVFLLRARVYIWLQKDPK